MPRLMLHTHKHMICLTCVLLPKRRTTITKQNPKVTQTHKHTQQTNQAKPPKKPKKPTDWQTDRNTNNNRKRNTEDYDTQRATYTWGTLHGRPAWYSCLDCIELQDKTCYLFRQLTNSSRSSIFMQTQLQQLRLV